MLGNAILMIFTRLFGSVLVDLILNKDENLIHLIKIHVKNRAI